MLPPEERLLGVRDLRVTFRSSRGDVRAVRGVSFDIARGEVMGLVGESGCGKSTVAHAIVRVLSKTASLEGAIDYAGRNVLTLNKSELRSYRWDSVALVMQGAMNALNPVTTIEDQIVDVVRSHRKVSRREARSLVPDLLELVGIDPGRRRAYPHELSGGMRQRCVIAIALALSPDLLVMDEPTTALDVVVQRSIMDELDHLRERLGFSVLLISHDLELVAERASHLAIMYAGKIVESGAAKSVVGDPKHPYTEALLGASMALEGPVERIRELPGSPPDLSIAVTGCAFLPRCAHAKPAHATAEPDLLDLGDDGHRVACYLYHDTKGTE